MSLVSLLKLSIQILTKLSQMGCFDANIPNNRVESPYYRQFWLSGGHCPWGFSMSKA